MLTKTRRFKWDVTRLIINNNNYANASQFLRMNNIFTVILQFAFWSNVWHRHFHDFLENASYCSKSEIEDPRSPLAEVPG